MFKNLPVTFILGCIIVVLGFGLSDSRKLLVNDVDLKKSETTIPSIPSRDTYNKTKEHNCLENITTFCVEIESYPHDELKTILNSDYDNYFVNKIPITSDKKIDDDLQMCESVVEYIRPIHGITADNLSQLIVNIGQNYTQEIRIERCVQKNSTCNYVKDVEGFKSYCTQAYTYQRLLSVDTSFSKVSFELFKIPFGCICASKKL